MLAKVHWSAVQGIVAHPVEVEVNDGYDETLTVIVGLPDAAVRESCNRILKVSRTIADLAGADEITSEHLSETLQYPSLDRQIWG